MSADPSGRAPEAGGARRGAFVVTPVKDSVDTALETARSVAESTVPVRHVVYDDFSTDETKEALRAHVSRYGYELVHLDEITDSPSPNYDLVLAHAGAEARERGEPMILVESDVVVGRETIRRLLEFHDAHPGCGLAGCITTDGEGRVNYPYEKFAGLPPEPVTTNKSLSFCCTLLSAAFVRDFDFSALDADKDWYDTRISRAAREMGFENYVLADAPVVHRPHSSRPWKQMKYTNPVRYYLSKLIRRRDRI